MLPKYDVLLLDIEGTVTSIQFVTEVLFPFARKFAADFLEKHWGEMEVMEDIERFRRLAADDAECGLDDVIPIPDDSYPADQIREHVLRSVFRQMDQDRKSTALKSLQGKIWQQGYATGELKSVLFPDVVPAFTRWSRRGAKIAIYSSGSVEAQKLLFKHTTDGDLTPYLSNCFDTMVGPKRAATSYVRIAQILSVPASAVLFCTDVVAEAEAARDAGMAAVILNRPGNLPQPPHTFPILSTFDSVS
ncbi:MAG: acireductone synthase [Myxococcales bacterium]|nr:acireductone synthase [Myxococcales bacterium]